MANQSGSGFYAAAETSLADCIHLICAEYLEMPGLHLTAVQVQRLWGLDPVMCETVLTTLVEVDFLKRTHHCAYMRES